MDLSSKLLPRRDFTRAALLAGAAIAAGTRSTLGADAPGPSGNSGRKEGIMTIPVMALLCVCAALVAPSGAGPEGIADVALLADRLLERGGISRGVSCVVTSSPRLVLEIARRSDLLVHAWMPERDTAAEARRLAEEAGLSADRVVIERGLPGRLPHADGTVDVVIAAGLPGEALLEVTRNGKAEILRVLRPLGRGIVEETGGSLAVLEKPEPRGTDSWSHWEHGPDNNPVSTDSVIRAPYRTQYLGLPYYITMPAISIAAGGRVFLAMGHIAHHRREEPWLNTLVATNGYNGSLLWTRRLPDGYLAHRSAFVATPGAFYMIDPDGDGCLILEPETGREVRRIATEETRGDWKWIALEGGILYALVGKEKDPAETTIVRSEYTHWSWGELSPGYYTPRVPWGFGTTLVACDAEGGSVLWRRIEERPVDSRAMALGGGRLYFYGPDSHLGCLDSRTGELQWKNDEPKLRELVEERGRGLTSTPGFRTTCYALWTPKALFFEAQTHRNVVAVSLEDGRVLWSRGKTTSNPNMMYLDGRLLVGIGPEGSTLALDPLTGETLADLGFKKRSCSRLTATPDSLFCRGWPEGLTRFDRLEKRVLFNGAFRPSCNDGVVPANGLLYAGPWTCDCNLSLMGRLALCSAGDFRCDQVATDEGRLEAEGGDPATVAPFEEDDRDWRTYRGNASRNGSTGVALAAPAGRGAPEILWSFAPRLPYRPTAPTSAGGFVFVAGSDGKVRAIGAEDGRPRWELPTAGPILQPPEIWGGRAYVGSGDGYVYCAEAATGRLLWRFRAAPLERRVMVYGALSSTWPVSTGVLVCEGVAYFGAGIVDHDGTYLYALDAVTGRIQWQNGTSGHLDPTLRKGVSVQGQLAVAGGRLWLAGGNVISPAPYDLRTGQYVGPGPGDGSPRSNRGSEIGVLTEKHIILGGRLLYSARENVVNPGSFVAIDISAGPRGGSQMPVGTGKILPAWDGRRLVMLAGPRSVPFAYASSAVERHLAEGEPRSRPEPLWTAGWAGGTDTVAIALAGDSVVTVAEVPRPRSLASDWRVRVLGAEDGAMHWERGLPGAAATGGLLVDRNGRIVVCLEDGRVVCLGARRSSP